MQGKRLQGAKKLAAAPKYVSPAQLTLIGFETPFDQRLRPTNRWVHLAHTIPWDDIVSVYDKLFTSSEGRPPLSGRVVLGALIIKHLESFTDRATIDHIAENMYTAVLSRLHQLQQRAAVHRAAVRYHPKTPESGAAQTDRRDRSPSWHAA